MLKYRVALITALVGMILVGAGLFSIRVGSEWGTKVEILSSPTAIPSDKKIKVEIAGEVSKPGVYELPTDSRIDDLLTLSQGLLEEADTQWVEKNINRAAKLADGQKVYIPNHSEVLSANTSSGGLEQNQSINLANQSSVIAININTASQSELEKLWGIGPKLGQKIIEYRPYSDTSELVSKKIITQKVFDKIKDQISIN